MNAEIITAIALGIALSASTGFRVFIPMLLASIAAHSNFFPATEHFEWLGSTAAMVSFGVATVVEVMAYYIPIVDNLLDAITTPLAVGAGTLLMTSVLPVDGDLLRWVTGFVVGGGAAATMQMGTVLTRLTSSKFTAGTVNPVVSTTENIAALGSSVLALFFPVFIAISFLILAIFLFRKIQKNRKARNKNHVE